MEVTLQEFFHLQESFICIVEAPQSLSVLNGAWRSGIGHCISPGSFATYVTHPCGECHPGSSCCVAEQIMLSRAYTYVEFLLKSHQACTIARGTSKYIGATLARTRASATGGDTLLPTIFTCAVLVSGLPLYGISIW